MRAIVFHKKTGPFLLKDLISDIEGIQEVIGDSEILIFNISTLDNASKQDITFFHNPKYIESLKNTKAGACILKQEDKTYAPNGTASIITKNPQFVFAKLIDKFYPKNVRSHAISKSAFIKPSATIGKNCCISEGVVIGENAKIGENSYIGHNTIIGDNVIIGENTSIESNVTIIFAIIGKNCSIYSGVRIGQDGFGFIPGGPKIRQVGIVEIGDNVEIGANSCIDRGTLENTIIKNNCKIDNLVQIGHNVVIDEGTIIAAQTGISGSTKIGKSVLIGGQVGVAGHLNIADKVMIAGKSGVVNNIKEGEVIGGYPAIKINNWHRQNIFLKKQIMK
ncbi:UDP-3-O-(3-hydroxymyristoyl)glucosamine N-acyltransferase [Candidatus Bandiella numerosa]|uniref:UDP-3-O-(3-hydroxymyristoyl)glucosamine N-acyltransferase n=1 Tax=Candidatus Bandiella numerosa TaxID=2570586 RepID=UPI00249E1295|nr:UDP-3-O-(3-hydroxymyristoyl)glucosamine N-acyltransferase [Candidatus Bandiella numerosa]WHA04353.1 UDP-3-O-(3-hydroxymyristoyl)glucosamine N-acyltransferase [Candidatus Bandiella numerosa]